MRGECDGVKEVLLVEVRVIPIQVDEVGVPNGQGSNTALELVLEGKFSSNAVVNYAHI